MMFLLRSAFWLTIVFALLPGLPDAGSKAGGGADAASPTPSTSTATSTAAGINPIDALAAAGAAVSDAGGFCGRQPQACAIGGEVIEAVAERAEAGVRFALSYVGAQIAGEKRRIAERAEPRPATSTLTIEDLAPDWQGLPSDASHRERPAAPTAEVPLPPKRPA